ncbi:MAG: DNA polymerase I, partial [Clostridia bacterium]|nr:DNA polymerase I [Clostridia bacterium]
GVHSKSKEVTKVALNNLNELENFKNKINNYFCYDLSKLEFACGGEEVFYVQKEISLFAETIDLEQILEVLKPIFENKNISKITCSSKEDVKVLRKHNIKLENFFDIDIAEYVLYAGVQKSLREDVCDYINLMTTLTSKMNEEKVFKIYNDIEIPLVEILADMEEEGFKVDEQILDQLAEKFDAEIAELVQKIYSLAGEEFNINSPKQVANILFEKLQLKSYNNKKQSTNFAVLDDMRWQHEIVDLIIRYRKLNKLISTYINVYKNICQKSGPVIHTMFNQTLTSTGRLSSSEPNMQNIPTRDEEGRNLRKIFVSKYDQGEIISADYSQIELRLLANMADEESMIHAYQSGIDIHTKTASEIFGVPVDKVTTSQRQDAKAVNFGIIYGISDYGLSQNIKTSRFKAKQYMESYFDRYPKIKTYMEQNIQFATENGFIRSYFGRIRHIPEIKSSNYSVRKFGERVAMNMPLQGTASDIIKIAMVKVAKRLKGMKSHIILQIHDELIVDTPKDEIEKVKTILK